MMEYLGELALAIILVIFMLQQREEFRNRVIRLVGYGRIAAGHQVRRRGGPADQPFLAHASDRQRLVRARAWASGCWRLGVKYALLWGFLGAMLRYLPYIGPYLAAVLPVSTSLAFNDGWTTTIMVIGLFVTLELVVANVVEPWLYGQSMGVSEIALLVSAAFWAFLWGPIGLVLSSPLTVCLVMLGPIRAAARVPGRPAGGRARAGAEGQLLPAAARARPGRGRGPDPRATEDRACRPDFRYDDHAGPLRRATEPEPRRDHRGRRTGDYAVRSARSSKTWATSAGRVAPASEHEPRARKRAAVASADQPVA